MVEGILTGVAEGSFKVHEKGALSSDGSTSSTRTLVGVSGVFEGATGATGATGAAGAAGAMIVTGTGGLSAGYEFTFEWPG